ncbi:MAG: hypothetical protein JXR51_08340 [Bacteroidales bacterium]|nr:hypothetical protein [Bacteroidales bacterium]
METKKFMELVNKGKIGEEIVKNKLIEQGSIIYETNFEQLNNKHNKSHPFDFMIFDKQKGIQIVEVKTITSRRYYNDTGITYNVYIKYKELSKHYNMPIYLYFVDKEKKAIYGNLLSELEIPYIERNITYPKVETVKTFNYTNKVIFFPLEKMKTIYDLNDEELEQIKIESKY